MNNIIKIKNPNISNLLYFKILDKIKRIFNFFFFNFIIQILTTYILYKYKFIEISDDKNFLLNLASINKFEFKSKSSVIKNTNVFVFYVDSKSSKFFYQRKADIGFKYFNELEMLVTFCQHINENFKNLNIILCTDKKTFIPNNLVINIIRLNFDQNLPMYSRNMLMKLYVRSKHFYQNTIFLDWDIILNFNPNILFDNIFDIAITYRNNDKLMPINEGVILANYKNKNNVIKYFNNLNSIYKFMSKDKFIGLFFDNILKWRGGQLSLAYMIKWKKLDYGVSLINNFNFLILDSNEYNFTPIKDISIKELKSKKIIHFKGWVKQYLNIIVEVLRN